MTTELPVGKWVRAKVRNSRFLGYAYIDPQAGATVRGIGYNRNLSAVHVERAINSPRGALRGAGFDLQVLADGEVRELGLPCPPPWYCEDNEQGVK